jgi:hypothetical protein
MLDGFFVTRKIFRFCVLPVIAKKHSFTTQPPQSIDVRMICRVDNCGRGARNAGSKYCEAHYYRLRRTGSVGTRPVRKNDSHSSSSTIEYRAWTSMRARCLCPTTPVFRHYGGRGIGICRRWGLFKNFLEDMGTRPGPEYSLDRIDNSKGYGPENCRWATKTEQLRNRRGVKLSPNDATEIRYMYYWGVPSSILAEIYEVAQTSVLKAAKGLSWS